MQYVTLGNTNLKVSRFCLGTMMFGGKTDAAESIRITRKAIEAGVNFVDTADVYTEGRCESILGDALSESGLRDQVVLASKAGMKVGRGMNDEGISRFHFVRAVENSLKRLKTDWIDLYYVHWPMVAMNLEEMMRTLEDLRVQGKILYAACSNFPAWVVMRSQWIADTRGFAPLVCGQYPYSLIERGLEIEILPMAKATGFGITVYRGLAIGLLTGKYLDTTPPQARGEDDERIRRWSGKYSDAIRKMRDFAKSRDLACADIANAWVASHPSITSVIVGISSLKQLEANLKDWNLLPEDRDTISAYFNSEVQEEAGGKFPTWRRSMEIGQ